MAIRIGCIGAGYIAGRHLANLAGMEGVSIVGVADPQGGRAEEYAGRYGGRAYGDWRAMLEAERPEAVYLCVPPFAHGEPEQALAEASIPFLVEKPLSTEPELPERIAAQVAARDLLTSVGYHWRYLDTMQRARDLAASHRPRLVLGYWYDFVPPPAWWVHRQYSGGQLVEQTTHIVDLARYLVGEVRRVFGAACRDGLTRYPESDIDSVSAAMLQFETGAIGVITSTCVVHYPHRIGLWLYAQDLILECRELSLRIETPEGRELLEPVADPYVLEDRAFVHALQTGDRSEIRVPYGEALRTHRLIMRVVQSVGEGRPLALTTEGLLREAELS